jgi:hypothetical protein
MAVGIETAGDEVHPGVPKVLFDDHDVFAFDVDRSGRRFLVAENPRVGASTSVDLVVNWFAEVRAKASGARTP